MHAVVAGRAIVIAIVNVASAAFENERGPLSVLDDATVSVVREPAINSFSAGRLTADGRCSNGTNCHSPNFAPPRHDAVDAVVAGPIAAGVVML